MRPSMVPCAFALALTLAAADVRALVGIGSFALPDDPRKIAVVAPYAYVTAELAGLRIIDVSEPSAPTEVGFVDTPGSAQSVAVEGGVAYLADGTAGLRVVDISTPGAPSEIGFLDTPGFAADVAAAAGLAVVADGDVGGLRIIDVSVPALATEVGSLDIAASEVVLVGSLAYVASNLHLRIVDLSTPSLPTEIGSLPLTGTAVDVDVDGTLAFVVERGPAIGTGRIQLVDVSDPGSPLALDAFPTPDSPNAVKVLGARAHVISFEAGLLLVDISGSPVQEGGIDTPGLGTDVALAGGLAYVIESTFDCLWIVDLSLPGYPQRVGGDDSFANPSEIVVIDDFAYVGNPGISAFRIFDASDPGALQEVGSFSPSGIADREGDLLFLAAGPAGLRVVDVANPAVPMEVGSLTTATFILYVTARGDRAYVLEGEPAEPESNLFRILDVSNPTMPSELGSLLLAEPRLAASLDVAGDLAWVVDWGIPGNAESSLRSIDVSNPALPVQVGIVEWSGLATRIQVVGQRAFVADIQNGLQIFDLANPASPVLIATLPSRANGFSDVQVVGDRAMAASQDSLSGVRVIDVSNPSAPLDMGGFASVQGMGFLDVSRGLVFAVDARSRLEILDFGPQFGLIPPAEPVPTLPPAMLALLAGLLLSFGIRQARAWPRSTGTSQPRMTL